MPLNVPGLLVPFHLLLNPRIIVPAIAVKDIRQINFHALKEAGYRGAVFDKDNCLTIPHKDTLVPELEVSWKSCRDVFGQGNVIIVSNSAGTRLDPGGIQAESVSYHLGAPVIMHSSLKPSYPCIKSIRSYFQSLKTPIPENKLVVVGDRIFTDVVMANRMKNTGKARILQETTITKPQEIGTSPTNTPLSIWTTGVWKREAMGMRCLEKALLDLVMKYSRPQPHAQLDLSAFVYAPEQPTITPRRSWIMERLRRCFWTKS
ncbi:hypothetical protein L218DRAFT_852328 [Marasmius fiardii PR-910]|nr:hypothetical protein L218DRAFT_852328 [Marasmius fiardii PR-910]